VNGSSVKLKMMLASPACSATADPSANSAPAEGTQLLVIRDQDTMRFDMAAPVVEAGKPVQVVLENEVQLVHDVSFQEGLKTAPSTEWAIFRLVPPSRAA
jgi:uncharacterized cupredoxin-like copper-binding protein